MSVGLFHLESLSVRNLDYLRDLFGKFLLSQVDLLNFLAPRWIMAERGTPMEDIRSVLTQFQSKTKDGQDVVTTPAGPVETPSVSEIPDVFFDVVLKQYKLNRGEIALLMFLYRQIWSKPNLYRAHGIGPLNSYADLSATLGISVEELGVQIRVLEKFGLLEIVRAGQYFVRRFFSEELDVKFGQHYDDFF